jgi:hypothetical protein
MAKPTPQSTAAANLEYNVKDINHAVHDLLDEVQRLNAKEEVIHNSLIWLGIGIIANLIVQTVYLFILTGKH